jgi:hypothetical protein
MAYVHGTYNRVCDRSGWTVKRCDMVRESDTGLLVYYKFADPPHPLDKPYIPRKEKGITEL